MFCVYVTARRTRLGHEYFCKQKFLDPASLALRHRSGFQVSAKRAQARFFRRARKNRHKPVFSNCAADETWSRIFLQAKISRPRLTRLTASFRLSSLGETCAGTFLPPRTKKPAQAGFFELRGGRDLASNSNSLTLIRITCPRFAVSSPCEGDSYRKPFKSRPAACKTKSPYSGDFVNCAADET